MMIRSGWFPGAACVLALGLASVGCAYDYAPVCIDVRDRASFAPVAGAEVSVSNTRTLNPHPPKPAVGVTDLDGSVTLRVAVYNDIIVRITPTDGPAQVFSVPHPVLAGPTGWIRPVRTAGGRSPTLEARVSQGLTQ